MTISGGKMRAAGALALLLTLAPETLAAQTVPDFSLPRTRPTSSTGAQGPVDDDNPVVRTAPRPTPAAPPPAVITPSPAPSTGAPAQVQPRGISGTQTGPRPTASTTQSPAAQSQRPGTAAAPASQASGTAVVPASSDQAVQPTVPTDATFGAADSFALPPVADSTVQPANSGWYWPWIAGAAMLLAALFSLLWWRKRKPAVKLLEFERPIVAAPKSEAEPVPVTPPAPASASPIVQSPATLAPGLSISLDARRMSASLMATTLNYVLTLTNTTDQPLSALAVEGDMIAAHGSLPADKQIAGDDQRLELRHALVTLAPGESAEFTGDFRLPLATLVPIRAGDAAYFIPLARWRVEASTAAGTPLVQVQTFVVGELSEQPGAALRPFRLDLGPRTYSRIGQRAVS